MVKLTQKLLQELFSYKQGELFWNTSPSNNIKAGKRAGHVDINGYKRTRIKGKSHRNHRLIFLYHYGFIPNCVDHINGNKLDNRIENLRKATRTQNNLNSKLSKRNSSGYKNVHWVTCHSKWFVQVSIDGKQKSFGYYDDVELAGLVAAEARDLYHKEFARHE